MKEWQFNILFFVGVGSAIFLLIAPEFGLNISENPTALAGVGSILTYILTQKGSLTKKDKRKKDKEKEDHEPFKSPYDEKGDE